MLPFSPCIVLVNHISCSISINFLQDEELVEALGEDKTRPPLAGPSKESTPRKGSRWLVFHKTRVNCFLRVERVVVANIIGYTEKTKKNSRLSRSRQKKSSTKLK